MRYLGVDPFQQIYALKRAGRLGQAKRRLYDAAECKLKPPFSEDPNHAWYCLGDLLATQGEYQLAKDAFRRALRSRANDAQALWAVGNCYSELQRPRLAERYFSKALRAPGANKAALLYNLANALFDQDKFREAIATYKRVVSANDRAIARLAKKNIVKATHAMHAQRARRKVDSSSRQSMRA